MKVELTEDKYAFVLFNKIMDKTSMINENFNPYERVIDNRKKRIKDWLDRFGSVIVSKENNRRYLVYKIPGIEEVMGTSYCICRVIDDETNSPIGVIEVKPIECFQ